MKKHLLYYSIISGFFLLNACGSNQNKQNTDFEDSIKTAEMADSLFNKLEQQLNSNVINTDSNIKK